MKSFIGSLFFVMLMSGCTAQWDLPKTPRTDPCTQVTQNSYVYVDPTCANPPGQNPRDWHDVPEHTKYSNWQ